jgi:hypothetical protein
LFFYSLVLTSNFNVIRGNSASKKEENTEAASISISNDTVDATSKFLSNLGCVIVVSSALFKELPAPFAASGLLLGVVADQIRKSTDASEKWADLLSELNEFNEEMIGPFGYNKLFEALIKEVKKSKGSSEAKEILVELQARSEAMNNIFRDLLNNADGFFKTTHAKKVFNAGKHIAAAEKARKSLKTFRDKLTGEMTRYSQIQQAQLIEALSHASFGLINHHEFQNIWKLSNWGPEVSVIDFCEGIRVHSTLSQNLQARVKSYLTHAYADKNNLLSPEDINNMTSGCDSSLSLEQTLLMILPPEVLLSDSLSHPQFRALWKYGETELKRFTSPTVSMLDFTNVFLAFGKDEKGLLKISSKFLSALKAKLQSESVTIADIEGISEGLDEDLSLVKTIEAVLTSFELPETPSELSEPQWSSMPGTPPRPPTGTDRPVSPVPSGSPAAAFTPQYQGLETVNFEPLLETPDRGVCKLCGWKTTEKNNYKFNGQGTPQKPYSPCKKMLEHCCK